ncbi:Ubiquitin carboxyl-terminal hydrolase [Pleurotus pulmonarius]
MTNHHPYTGSGQPYYPHQYSYPTHSTPHSPIPGNAPFQFQNPYGLPPSPAGIPPHMHMNGHHHHQPTRVNGHGRGAYTYAHNSYNSRPVAGPSYPYPSHAPSPKYPPYQAYPTAYPPPHIPYPPQHWTTPQLSHSQINSPQPKQSSVATDDPQPATKSSPNTDAAPVLEHEPIEVPEALESNETQPSPSPPPEPIEETEFIESSPTESSIPATSNDIARGAYAIWSRRPRHPSQAPGIIISSHARPPPGVVKYALELPTPPASPPVASCPLPDANEAVDEQADVPEEPAEDVKSRAIEVEDLPSKATIPSLPSSSTATDATNTPSTTTPGSPVSTTNTSVSLNATPVKLDDPVASVTDVPVSPENHTPTLEPEQAPTPEVSTSKPIQDVTPPPTKPPAAPKKSWASLLQQPNSSSSGKQRNALPTSSVVGVSIPADAPTQAPSSTGSINQTKKTELLKLLLPHTSSNTPVTPTHSYANAAVTAPAQSASSAPPAIRPRGLVNTGNMCFANSVLQVLIYCQPFHKLFVDLGKTLGEGGGAEVLSAESTGEGEKATPLIDATIKFLNEFQVAKAVEVEAGRRGGKGKEKEVNDDDWDGESFIPTYVYDALKEKKRFDHMRGGQQEDAEEFLGFYLETLEEELSLLLNAVSPASVSRPKAKVEEREEEAPPEEDGWLEVGKKNRSVITRTVNTIESAITRIFGGKFRYTLRAPGQKDSVIVEAWRSLRLDIQPEQIHTIQDALSHISQPQSVQMTLPTKPGVSVDASQLVLIESLPPVLILHMKRFCYDTKVGGVVKVGKHVAFAPELDVKSDVMVTKRPPVTKYKLFGIIYHHGTSASGGHYTLDVLHPNRYPTSIPGSKPREGWMRIDDELVSDVRPDDVFSPSIDDTRCAYLLFYRRIGK